MNIAPCVARRTLARCLLVASAALCADAANADVAASDLLTQLTSKDTTELTKAQSYLSGVLDAEDFYLGAEMLSVRAPLSERKATKFKFAHLCLPTPRPGMDALVGVILAYAKGDASRGTGRAHSMIRFALLDKFPCTENP